ncbi:MAG: DUF2784 domain-containing protein [Gemmatimonadota bacterium]|nr:DUF2784 domain-containing protein [Gemmatimonadota bacterium]
MIPRLAADLVLVLHATFVVFVVVGGWLVLRWPKVSWIHVPAAIWGALVELANWTCPLTPLEIYFRRLAGQAGYSGGFIEHYVGSVLYPAGLTPGIRVALGVAVVAVNAAAYGIVIRKRRMEG